jgi:hypothetical protein
MFFILINLKQLKKLPNQIYLLLYIKPMKQGNCLIGFYVTPKQYRSFGDFPALLVEEDLRCPSVHYFRHDWAHE